LQAAGVLAGPVDVAARRPWYLLSTEFTLTFPPGQAPDLEIVQRIRREFFAEYVPLWCRRVYKDPSGHEVITGWHVVGEWVPAQDDPYSEPVSVQLPSAPTELYPFTGGVVYEVHGGAFCDEWAPGSRGAEEGAPPDALPYDMRVYHWMLATDRWLNREYGTLKQKGKERLAAIKEKERRHLEFVEEEARLSLNDDRHMLKRAIEQGRFTDPPKGPQPYVQAEKVFEESTP